MHCPHACLQHGTYFCMGQWVVFVLCLPTLWVVLLLGLFGWFPLLSFRSPNAATSKIFFDLPHTMWYAFGREVKVKFYVFFICPLWVWSSFWLCDEAFSGTDMHVRRSWVWLSFRCLFSVFHTACHQFLIDLAWQNGPKRKSWKTFCHILFGT